MGNMLIATLWMIQVVHCTNIPQTVWQSLDMIYLTLYNKDDSTSFIPTFHERTEVWSIQHTLGPFIWQNLTQIRAWIGNHISFSCGMQLLINVQTSKVV